MPVSAYTGATVQLSHSNDPLPLPFPELPSCTSVSCSHSHAGINVKGPSCSHLIFTHNQTRDTPG